VVISCLPELNKNTEEIDNFRKKKIVTYLNKEQRNKAETDSRQHLFKDFLLYNLYCILKTEHKPNCKCYLSSCFHILFVRI